MNSSFKRFRRQIYKIIAIAFASIAVLDIGLWIRGQFATDVITSWKELAETEFQMRFQIANTSNALVSYDLGEPWSFQEKFDDGWNHREWDEIQFDGVGRILGVRLPPGDPLARLFRGSFAIAHRTIVIVSLLAFALFARLGWKKQFAAGTCQKCGYDLRATPDRCPECGAVAR